MSKTKNLESLILEACDVLDRAGNALQPRATRVYRESVASVCWELADKLERALREEVEADRKRSKEIPSVEAIEARIAPEMSRESYNFHDFQGIRHSYAVAEVVRNYWEEHLK